MARKVTLTGLMMERSPDWRQRGDEIESRKMDARPKAGFVCPRVRREITFERKRRNRINHSQLLSKLRRRNCTPCLLLSPGLSFQWTFALMTVSCLCLFVEQERKKERKLEREKERDGQLRPPVIQGEKGKFWEWKRNRRERERGLSGGPMDGWMDGRLVCFNIDSTCSKENRVNKWRNLSSLQKLCLFPVKTRFLWYLERFQARLVKSEFKFWASANENRKLERRPTSTHLHQWRIPPHSLSCLN